MRSYLPLILLLFLILLVKDASRLGFDANNRLEELQIKGLNYRITNELSDFKYSGYIKRQAVHFINRWELAGISMAVVKDGKLVFAHGYGYADKEAKEKVEPGHLFRIASVSKLLTASAILKLVERGDITLDSKVFGPDAIIQDSVFNKVRDKRLYRITVKHLLAHSAGWTFKYTDPAFNPIRIAGLLGEDGPATMDTYYRYISKYRLSFTPGTRVFYSNMGYLFLGQVIEQITGKSCEEYIQTEILLPLGISDMHLASSMSDERRENEVKYYEQEDSPLVKASDGSGQMVPKTYGGNPVELLGPAGGWLASSVELAKFVVHIDGWDNVPDIFPDHIMQQMINHNYAEGPLGWKTVTSGGDWWRTGSMAGTSAMIKRQRNGITWVVLINSSCWKGSKLPRYINQLMRKIESRVKQWPEQNLFDYYPTN